MLPRIAAPERLWQQDGGGAAGGTEGGSSPPPPPAASPPPPPPPPGTGDAGGGGSGTGEAKLAGWDDHVKSIGDEQARTFAGRFTSLEELAKGGLELRKHASEREGFVKLLKDGSATPAEVAAWNKAVGAPEAPEGYGIELPQGAAESDSDKEWWGTLQKIAHADHVPRKGLQNLVKAVFDRAAGLEAARELALAQVKDAGMSQLRTLWGPDFDRNQAIGDRAHSYFGDSEWDTFAREVGFVDHPAYRRFLAKVGREIAPHNPIIAYTPSETADHMNALQKEYGERASKGTLNDPDFQRRWAEGWQRKAGTA